MTGTFEPKDEDAGAAVLYILKPLALEYADTERGQFILMRMANHLWPNPHTEWLLEQQDAAEEEAGKRMVHSSVELV